MPTVLSEEEFFTGGKSADYSRGQSSPRTISTDEFLGVDPLSKEALQPSLAKELFTTDPLAAMQRGLKQGAGMAAQVADMALGLPGQAIRVGANIGGRVKALASGGSAADADWAGKALADQVPRSLTNPVGAAMEALGYGKDYNENQVAHVMENVMGVVSKGGEWIEEKTGKVLTKRGVEDIFETFMLSLGARGAAHGLDPKFKALGAPGLAEKAKIKPPKGGWRTPREEPTLGEEPLPTPDVRVTPDGRATAFTKRSAEGPGVWQTRDRPPVGEATDLAEEPKIPVGEATEVPNIPTGEALEIPDIPTPQVKTIGGAVGDRIAKNLTAERDARAFEDAKRVRPDTYAELKAKGLLPAVVAGTGLGLAILYPDQKEEALGAAVGALAVGRGKGLTLDAIHALPEATPVKVFRDQSATTLLTLERLPENGYRFRKQTIEDQLKRQDVTKAERELIQGVMKEVEGDTITAKQLYAGVKLKTGDWELTRKETSRWADYGFEAIDRKIAPGEEPWIPEDATAAEEAALRAEHKGEQAANTATTTLYDLPEGVLEGEGPAANHFGDPNYFAHTRSFVEDGIRHVVEIQSDLAQKARKVLTKEERGRLEGELTAGEAKFRQYEALLTEAETPGKNSAVLQKLNQMPEFEDAWRRGENNAEVLLKRAINKWGVDAAEIRSKLAQASSTERIQPLIKDWYKRIVREELAREARDRAAAEQNLPEYRRAFKEEVLHGDDLARAQAMLKAPSIVRFATADTVAKVEGWPERYNYKEGVVAHSDSLVHNRRVGNIVDTTNTKHFGEYAYTGNVKFDGASIVYELKGKDGTFWAYEPGNAGRAPADVREALGEQRGLRPEHQSIYDRYRGDIEPSLLQLKGVDLPPGVLTSEARAALETSIESLKELQKRVKETPVSNEAAVKSTLEDVVKTFGRQKGFDPARIDRMTEARLKDLQTRLDYKPDFSKFYHTDLQGHTWIEVPTEGSAARPAGPRVQMLGGVDPKLATAVAAIGGGAALVAYLSPRENRKKNAALAAAILGLAAFARERSPFVREWVESAGRGAEKVLSVISEDIRNASPALLKRMRDHERWVMEKTHERLNTIVPFVTELRKLPEAAGARLNAALLTGDAQAIRDALIASGSRALQTEYSKVREILNDMGRELHATGRLRKLVMKASQEYYPRIVTDLEGLLASFGKEERSVLQKMLDQAERISNNKTGLPLTPVERSFVVGEFLKQRSSGQGRSGFLKQRSIGEVTPELARFYAPASESLPIYIRAMTKEIERAKFFGEDLVRDPETGVSNLELSIQRVVERERTRGVLDDKQIEKLRGLLASRFGPGEAAADGYIQTFRNLTNVGLLGNITSAGVQAGDLALPLAAYGLLPTVRAVATTITRRPLRATVRDIGLVDHISEEVTGGVRTPLIVLGREVSSAKFVEKVFKFTGFSLVDQFGKAVSINASWDRARRAVATPAGTAKLKARYGEAWGQDFEALVKDLRSGEMTENVKSLLFYDLSDLQPISKLEVPKAYLDHPNGRVLYQMKTYMVKQMNVLRREALGEMRRGNVRQGMTNLLRYGLALGISGATTSFIVNWMLGKDTKLEWGDIPENALKTMGWSSYVVDKARKGEPLSAIAGTVAPPWKMWDRIITMDPSAVQYLPPLGKLYYYNAMGGAQKADAFAEKQRRLVEMPDDEYERMLEKRRLKAERSKERAQ